MPESTPVPTSVYRYYDRIGVVIYIGITETGIVRNQQHNRRAEWWPYVVRQDVEHYPSRQEAAARERELIRHFRPPFNRQHNVDAGGLKAAYFAVVEGGLTLDQAEINANLMKGVPLLRDPRNPAVLRTQPYHASLARHLEELPKGKTEVPVNEVNGQRLGTVTRLNVIDEQAIITCNRALPPSLRAFAQVACQRPYPRPLYRLAKVKVVQDRGGRT